MSKIATVAVLSLVLAACSNSGLSMSEYGERLDEIRVTYEPRAETAWIEYLQVPQPTLEDLEILIGREVAVRAEIEEALRALDPPEEIQDLHATLADWVTELRLAGEGLLGRAGTAAEWDEFFASAEYQTFGATLIGGAAVCNEFQARLDATAAREAFADSAWIPGEMKEVVEAVIGCDTIPNDVDEIFRR